MNTNNVNSNFIRLEFDEVNIGKHVSVKHFKNNTESDLTKHPFTKSINISKDRGFAKSNPDYWIKTKEGKKWSKRALTGMFKTDKANVFYGDIKHNGKKTNSVLFEFTTNNKLIVTYFKFYNNNTEYLTKLI